MATPMMSLDQLLAQFSVKHETTTQAATLNPERVAARKTRQRSCVYMTMVNPTTRQIDFSSPDQDDLNNAIADGIAVASTDLYRAYGLFGRGAGTAREEYDTNGMNHAGRVNLVTVFDCESEKAGYVFALYARGNVADAKGKRIEQGRAIVSLESFTENGTSTLSRNHEQITGLCAVSVPMRLAYVVAQQIASAILPHARKAAAPVSGAQSPAQQRAINAAAPVLPNGQTQSSDDRSTEQKIIHVNRAQHIAALDAAISEKARILAPATLAPASPAAAFSLRRETI